MQSRILIATSGNLTRDAKLEATKGGTPVLKFGMAINNGKKDDPPQYINCEVYGKRAEGLAKCNLAKGTPCTVNGYLSTREYTGKNGKAFSVDVDVIDVNLFGSKADGAGSATADAGFPE